MKKAKSLKNEIQHELIGIILIAIGLFICFCLWMGNETDAVNSGAIGSFIYRILTSLFGFGKVILPFFLFILGLSKLRKRLEWDKFTLLSWFALFLCILTIFHLRLPVELQGIAVGWNGHGGGIIGAIITRILLALFGAIGSYILIATCICIAFIGIMKKPLALMVRNLLNIVVSFYNGLKSEVAELLFENDEECELNTNSRNKRQSVDEAAISSVIVHNSSPSEYDLKEQQSSPALIRNNKTTIKNKNNLNVGVKSEAKNDKITYTSFLYPPLDILQFPPQVRSQRLNKDITDNISILEDTLDNFGIKAKVIQVSRGPSITRYEIQPSPGIKVSRIVNLADDIALSLAAPQVRIEAPIPGKAAVGIEVPNTEISMVTLREVLETPLFRESESRLTVALGKDIAGNPIVADLGKMPHLLIAGATGSGKSVCMNSLIASILFKASPHEVKLVMIDPKVVELSIFNGIPHLISPVVTDAKKAATALRWAVHEMENRYELFASLGVKDIFRYNKTIASTNLEEEKAKLPFIVILIDELADLMMVAPADVEDAIARLAQMARAAGIHLVVATQRPSVDVITGLIKANIPSRISFAVSSQTDSRTILDMGGAERLLGRGDMLFYPTGMAKPLRVQGVFVSDNEIEGLVNFLTEKTNTQETDIPWQNVEIENKEEDEADELLSDAAKLFIECGQASISLLQRRLRIGYTRAARIIDQLEDRGIVGAYEGSKPRTIRMTWEEYEKTFGN